MNARLRPPAQAGPTDVAAQAGPASPGDQACCCVARAVVRVTMPPGPGRPDETELLLCGHHYRVSRAALAAAHAQVEELHASWVAAQTWFDDHDRSACATAVTSNTGKG